ncbi:MAG: GNAT family N-acetyltransferase [Planctomycetales bacterium]|nr:GNAT family N-acetyltransferase [Planctomycetales bacterium]
MPCREIDVRYRPYQPDDDIEAITELLHRSYAPLAEMGLRFHATWQDAETTRRRLTTGHALIAESGGTIIGTVTLYGPWPESPCQWYRRDDVYHFGQFAVHPDLQRAGIGAHMLEMLEADTVRRGGRELALDTAEPAEHLTRWYARLGYRVVGHVTWEVTNYRSVVMSKRLV